MKQQTPKRHFGKTIWERNLYSGPLKIVMRTLEVSMTLSLPVITCPAGGYEYIGLSGNGLHLSL